MALQTDLFSASDPVPKIDKGASPASFAWARPEERGPYWYASRIGSAPGGVTARIFQSAISGRLVLVIEWPALSGFPVSEYVASVDDGMARADEWLPRIAAHLGGAHG
ncbi:MULTISPECIES: hypothetical protein [unclassified Xanthobacter]|uniref:hypothetical protein n=1 Tax=unclassified Xanthobacter TaxID=2623496 RepID=UPI001EDDF442|nr:MULTISPECIES: hypothetical protein [unclassified Xanthobacter]